jgi:predicted ABC-type ATPase
VPEAELSLSRIRDRVLEGGHDVPEPIVRRRYERSIKNFLQVYRSAADAWMLFDNSGEALETIAFEKLGEL